MYVVCMRDDACVYVCPYVWFTTIVTLLCIHTRVYFLRISVCVACVQETNVLSVHECLEKRGKIRQCMACVLYISPSSPPLSPGRQVNGKITDTPWYTPSFPLPLSHLMHTPSVYLRPCVSSYTPLSACRISSTYWRGGVQSFSVVTLKIVCICVGLVKRSYTSCVDVYSSSSSSRQ